MKTLLAGSVGALAIVAGLFGGAGASATGSSPTYLALGDSVAAGTALQNPAADSYVALVHNYVKQVIAPGQANAAPGAENGSAISALNISVPGETTSSMLGGQLQDAVDLLRDRNQDDNPVNDVRVVTMDIGGNDAFEVVPRCIGGLTLECQVAVVTMLGAFQANFQGILNGLRQAAGPETEIVVMTYFNPLLNPGCALSPHAATAGIILEGGAGLPLGLNDIIRAFAPAFGAEIAETSGLLGPGDLTTDCHHPNEQGHAKIASAFNAVIGD